jgi:hypothetical protein
MKTMNVSYETLLVTRDQHLTAAVLNQPDCVIAPLAARRARKSPGMTTELDLDPGYRFEPDAHSRTIPTKDRLAGALAFNEERKPVFRGE